MAAISSAVNDEATATATSSAVVSGVTFLHPPLDWTRLYAVGDPVWALQDSKPFARAIVETTLAPQVASQVTSQVGPTSRPVGLFFSDSDLCRFCFDVLKS